MPRHKLNPKQIADRAEKRKAYAKDYYKKNKEKILEQIAAISRRKEYLYKLYNEGLLRVAPSADDLQEYIINFPLSTHSLEKFYAIQE